MDSDCRECRGKAAELAANPSCPMPEGEFDVDSCRSAVALSWRLQATMPEPSF